VSDTKKWTAMMSRKPELDLGGQARKIENQRVQIKRLTEKNLGLHLALAHSKTRIEELEAEVARLRAESDQLGRMWEANQELLAESKEIGFQFDEVKRLTAENARLREALKECADDLESYVNQEYTIEQRDKYPNMEAKYVRDMAPVAKARAALNPGKDTP
jgi:chromosome segregation ATPase